MLCTCSMLYPGGLGTCWTPFCPSNIPINYWIHKSYFTENPYLPHYASDSLLKHWHMRRFTRKAKNIEIKALDVKPLRYYTDEGCMLSLKEVHEVVKNQSKYVSEDIPLGAFKKDVHGKNNFMHSLPPLSIFSNFLTDSPPPLSKAKIMDKRFSKLCNRMHHT